MLRHTTGAGDRQLLSLEFREVEGVGQIVHTAKLDLFDDGPEKPVRIWSRIGRRPILAGGNANGDIPMLAFAAAPVALPCACWCSTTTRSANSTTPPAPKKPSSAPVETVTVVSVKKDWKTVLRRLGRHVAGARRMQRKPKCEVEVSTSWAILAAGR